VILAEDGKSLYVVCGNNTRPIEGSRSRVPRIWDEDLLLPRIYGVGFMRGTPAPAGAIYRVDPDGKDWERVSSGFRNPFDIALNADGELFTFDADMEWDIGTPWYRPTRVCHVVSGADWGWRNGSGKWPVYFADTLPPVVNVGLTSPTGIAFGYGAKFPPKYQHALFLCDWTYGTMYAVHLEPLGSSYIGTCEEFISATPLPFTDVVIHPRDGAMYFLIGGRRTQSGLYRVTYAGTEPTAPVAATQRHAELRDARRMLEAFHGGVHPEAIDKVWPYLKDEDRFIRFAARTALEHQPLENWQQRALAEGDPQTSLTALLALVRKIPRSYQSDGPDIDTPPPTYPADDDPRHPLQPVVLSALASLDWSKLKPEQKLELLRAYQLAFYRLGPPDEAARRQLIARLEGFYPADARPLNVMLTELLCYLQSPSAAAKGMQLLAEARTQEEQVDYVRSLRFLSAGWTRQLHRELFEWFRRAAAYKGGNNFETFIEELKRDSLAHVPDVDRVALADVINAPVPDQVTPLSAQPRPFIKEWTMEEVMPLVETRLNGRDFERGRAMFAAANCFGCHHFAQEGGAVGPDLTGLAGRFSPRDILESILEPDKVISDQYAAVVIETADGKVVTGRLTNFHGDKITVNTNMLDPNATETVHRNEIELMSQSATSMMPSGLINTLTEEELLDLMAFLLSRGNPRDPMFAQEAGADKAGKVESAAISEAVSGGN
jgi:putative heme-binding domain-containing protein